LRKSQDGRGHAGGSTFGRESLDYSTRTPDRSSTLRTLKRRDKTYPDRSNVLRIARLVLEQVDALVETGRHSGRGEAGRLSIGFCTSMSAGNLRATLLDFKNRSPYVELATVERSRIRLMTALRNGTVDIVISPGGRLSPDNKALSLWSERVQISLPEDHALAAREVVYWTDLRNETVLLSQHDPGRGSQNNR